MASNKLSILLEKGGLSFLVTKDDSWVASEFSAFDKNMGLRENLIAVRKNNIYLQQTYDEVKFCTLSSKFLLVPNTYYPHATDAAWLGFDADILEEEKMLTSAIPSQEAVLIYAVHKDLIQFAKDNYQTKKVSHAGEFFLSYWDNSSTDTQAFVNFLETRFELAIVKNQKLFLYNIFDYDTKNDVLYHILNVFKQLEIDSNTVKLYYYGLVNAQDILKMMMNYIRHVIPATTDLQRMNQFTLIENLQS